MPARKKDYLENSSRWPFRLYTRKELMELLRVSSVTLWRMEKAGVITPIIRRDGMRTPNQRGLVFYTDKQAFKAILYLFPGIVDEEINAVKEALFRSTADEDGR